jgi:hypothetical protein
MLDVAVAYNTYKFIGEEFLTWFWFVIDTDISTVQAIDNDFNSLEIGNRIVLENRKKESTERITIKGDGASLEEGILALKKGALVTELNLIYQSNRQNWQFTIKGESLNLSSLSTPKIGLPESPEDLEGFVLEKAYLYDKLIRFLEKIFAHFIKLRILNKWQKTELPLVHKWIHSKIKN